VSGTADKRAERGNTSAKKRKTKEKGVDGTEDDESPSKKPRVAKKATKAKKEIASEEDEDNDVAARKDAAEGRDGEGDEEED